MSCLFRYFHSCDSFYGDPYDKNKKKPIKSTNNQNVPQNFMNYKNDPTSRQSTQQKNTIADSNLNNSDTIQKRYFKKIDEKCQKDQTYNENETNEKLLKIFEKNTNNKIDEHYKENQDIDDEATELRPNYLKINSKDFINRNMLHSEKNSKTYLDLLNDYKKDDFHENSISDFEKTEQNRRKYNKKINCKLIEDHEKTIKIKPTLKKPKFRVEDN